MFINTGHASNSLLHPSIIADMYLREDPFEGDSDLDIYDDKSQIIFYRVNEGVFITMDISNDSSNIYYFTAVIADSFEDFMNKLEKNSTYFEEFEI